MSRDAACRDPRGDRARGPAARLSPWPTSNACAVLHRVAVLLIALALTAGCASAPPADHANLANVVAARERAFARTMADRDHRAFADFIADEAIFWTGPKPLRGRQAVADAWQRFYTAADAPFSWEPDAVEVLASGTLALSTGPVRDPTGKVIARFTSIWRLEPDGVWRVVFDRGNEVCDCR